MEDYQNTILIVDDDPDSLKVLFQCLENTGFKVLIAVNAKTTLETINHTQPDIIILDIILPDMDGFELCRRLREMPDVADTPIIFLSCLNDTADKLQGFNCAVDYVTKPFQLKELIARIEKHLTLHKLQKQLEEQNQRLQQEIAEHKRAEKALRKSEVRYRRLFQDSPISLWLEDFSELKSYLEALKEKGVEDFRTYFDKYPEEVANSAAKIKIKDVNEATLNIYEAQDKSQLLQRLDQVFGPESYPVFKEELVAIAQDKPLFEAEAITQTLQRKKNHIYLKWAVAPDQRDTWSDVVVSIVDITERKQAEEQLKTALREKEVLLKEVYHRAKNNFQTISSLLYLQSKSIKDPHTLEILQESINRINSMAHVHQRLYHSDNLAEIDFAEFSYYIAAELFHFYHASLISFNISQEKVFLPLEKAIPCALILNELVTNALKYAFPEGRSGEIRVELAEVQDQVILRISDNGVGFPDDVDFRNTSSMGLMVATMLAKQLRGTITLDKKEGTAFTITFPK